MRVEKVDDHTVITLTPSEAEDLIIINKNGTVEPVAKDEPFDICPGCDFEFPAGYLIPDGLCQMCIDDTEGTDLDEDD